VIAVSPQAEDAEIEVDLGEGREGQAHRVSHGGGEARRIFCYCVARSGTTDRR
jgi:hypothetical protein